MRNVDKLRLATAAISFLAGIAFLIVPIGKISYGPTCTPARPECIVNPVLITVQCTSVVKDLSKSAPAPCHSVARNRTITAVVLGILAVAALSSLAFRRSTGSLEGATS